MNKASYLLALMLGLFAAHASLADDSPGQNAPASPTASSAAVSASNGNKTAMAVKSVDNRSGHRGSNMAIVGGTARKTANINGSNVRLTH